MSYVLLTKGATPGSPASGKVLVGVDAEGRLYTHDATGVMGEVGDHDMANLVRNSGFWFAQRQAPGTLTTYSNVGGRIIAADGWGISCENASAQYRRVDTSGAAETGLQGRYWGEFTKITATGKIIVTQVIEGVDAQALRGRTVRVQFWAKAIIGTPITLKIGLLSWAGTVDAVPSGAGLVFSAHGANGVDPTLAANFSYLAPKTGVTPDNATAATNNATCSATTTWQRFGAVFDVPTSCRNLVVMIHSDNQIVATNGFALSQVSLTDGFETQNWSPLDYASEFSRVQRYYQKTFAIDTLPAASVGIAGSVRGLLGKAGALALAGVVQWRYPVCLRAAATTITLFNPSAAGAQMRQTSGTAADMTATATANSADSSVDVTATGAAGGAVGDQVGVHITADAEL